MNLNGWFRPLRTFTEPGSIVLMDKPAADDRDGFSEFNRLTRRLSGLDERGLVLSLSAFAEDSLGELLRAFMRRHTAADDLLDGFNAPLGTFSARIKAAVALGLITPEQFSDLENLRKVRNKFSHTWEDISFEDHSIKARIKNLSFSPIDDEFPNTSFKKIKSSISAIIVEIRVTINQVETRGLRAKIIGSRLFAGLSGSSEEDQLASARNSFAMLREKFQSSEQIERDFLAEIKDRLLYRIRHAARQASPQGRSEFHQLEAKLVSENWMGLDDHDHVE